MLEIIVLGFTLEAVVVVVDMVQMGLPEITLRELVVVVCAVLL